MVQPGYNAQSVMEGQNRLIVVAEVSNQQTDKRLLGAMVQQAIDMKEGSGDRREERDGGGCRLLGSDRCAGPPADHAGNGADRGRR